LRNLMPGFTHAAWAGLEGMMESQMALLAMFAFVALQRS
jgi:hypothetical protein